MSTETKVVEIKILRASLGVRPGYQSPVPGEGLVWLADVLAQLDEARRQSSPVVLLTIDSLGGESYGAAGLFHALRTFSEIGGKVVAFVSGYAASIAAAYVLGADYVVASPGARFGLHGNVLFEEHPSGTPTVRAPRTREEADLLRELNMVQAVILRHGTWAAPEQVTRWCALTGAAEILDARTAEALGFVDLVGDRSAARSLARELALGKSPSTARRERLAPLAGEAAERLRPVRECGAFVVASVSRATRELAASFTFMPAPIPGFDHASVSPQGHLVSRQESFAAPVELSMTGLFHHLSSATKDIAMREALLNSYELITDQRFRDLIQVTAGEDALKVLDKWIRDVANDHMAPDGGESALLSLLTMSRRGLTASIFVANAAQALQNLAGVGNVLAKVDAGYLWQGITEVAGDRQKAIDFVNQKSGEMRHRQKSFDRDIKENLQRLMGQASSFARAQEVGLWAMQTTDMTVAYPTWLAAYRQALAGKVESVAAGDDAAAVIHADSTVRRALGSGSTKDLAALMRSPQGKMVTMFYGFANAQLNQVLGAVSEAGTLARDGQHYKALRRLTRVYFAVVGGAILAELLVGRGPSDYDDDGKVTSADWSKWIAMRSALAPITMVPLLGPLARSAESGMSVSMLAYERFATDAARVVRRTVDLGQAVIDEDDPQEAFGNLGRDVGLAAADFLPGGGQARATLGYWLDKERNRRAGFAERAMGTAFGKPREGRLSEVIFGE